MTTKTTTLPPKQLNRKKYKTSNKNSINDEF